MMHIMTRVSYAGSGPARRWFDGSIDRAAVGGPTRLSPRALARAAQRTRFRDVFRSHEHNYNPGQDLVRAVEEACGGIASASVRRRCECRALLQSPRLRSELR